jgi:UDP-N-acetylglucosamine--N-acetylmuramyl-(pentapeptide) pyrophosphoryl-undecaprenol N-acetylglucosamine transferase
MKRSCNGVLIMAGGTGGHIFPGLAVADTLRARDVPVRWLGAEGGMETRTVPEAGIEMDLVAISGLRGKGVARWLRMPFILLRAVRQARRHLAVHRPCCALSFGGYVAAPGGIAAWTKGIPVIVHEQNRVPGMTNRLLAVIARTVLQGFPGTFPQGKHAVDSGNPVRPEVAAIDPPQSRLGGRTGPVRILVTGGSQGALVLNQTVPAAIGLLPSAEVDIRHQAGAGRVEEALDAYADAGVRGEVTDFIGDMAAAYGWADLVVCRSGALTVAELAAAGVAAILVPYAHAVDDHQTRNAEYLADADAAVLIPQASLTARVLADALAALLSDREKLVSMACAARRQALPDAAKVVADTCDKWVNT